RMKHYNFSDILLASRDRDEMDLWREELSGKIVVISEVTTGSTDLGPVPTDSSFPLSGIHSNVINTILTGEFLREVPVLVMMMIEILLLGVVVLLSLRFTPLYFSLSILCIGVLYAGAASAAFLYANTIMHLIRPLLMLAFALIAVVVFRYFTEEREKLEGLRQRDFIRATFGRFLSNEVVEELLGTPGALEMNGEIREVTFLVSDLRGFTALSTVLSPREVINILNRYLEQMVDIISRYGGTVNDFQGDGIIAFFGAPLHEEDDPQRAVACALAMQNAMGPFNEDQRRRGLPELAMGIGINGGEVVVGNIGSEKRAKYSAIGTPINMAYRIEANTVGGQILISPETFEKVSSQVDVRGTLTAQFKGIDRPVNLYEICGIQGRYKTALAEKPDDSVAPITSPLSVKCFVLKGKTVSEDVIMGRILGIGRSSAEIALESPVAVLANVKLELVTEDGSGFPEMYAKVMSVEQTDAASSKFKARMEFTWLPPILRRREFKVTAIERAKAGFQPWALLLAVSIHFAILFPGPAHAGKKPEILTFQESESDIDAVFFSPDGRHIMSAGNGRVKVWDVSSGGLLKIFGPERLSVWSTDPKGFFGPFSVGVPLPYETRFRSLFSPDGTQAFLGIFPLFDRATGTLVGKGGADARDAEQYPVWHRKYISVKSRVFDGFESRRRGYEDTVSRYRIEEKRMPAFCSPDGKYALMGGDLLYNASDGGFVYEHKDGYPGAAAEPKHTSPMCLT
ncbi:MAG: CHASE2 domain-containing protein, partial [Deltaproteobacteria bacterium]|nr:CHASE2 domain-containing protein [Deltaproteobacteria bacterium]